MNYIAKFVFGLLIVLALPMSLKAQTAPVAAPLPIVVRDSFLRKLQDKRGYSSPPLRSGRSHEIL
jgi:hypothetical protein